MFNTLLKDVHVIKKWLDTFVTGVHVIRKKIQGAMGSTFYFNFLNRCFHFACFRFFRVFLLVGNLLNSPKQMTVSWSQTKVQKGKANNLSDYTVDLFNFFLCTRNVSKLQVSDLAQA